MKHLTITTAEIAKICGVSQGTVDRALNHRPDIKAETKEKIIRVAKKYGYREFVGTEKENITGQIGVIIFDLNNEYFAELVTELEYALRKENLGTIIMMSHYDKQYEIECIRNLYNMGVKGIILCSVNCGEDFENYLRLFDIPIVAVGNQVASLPYVGIDDFGAMREMTLAVLEENPQNLIYFSPALGYADAYAQRRRYEGFLSAAGGRQYSVITDLTEIKQKYEEKTIILCSNDYYALKVYFKGCNAKITGFDNIRIVQQYKIGIDSVGYAMAEIAKEAIQSIKTNRKEDVIIRHTLVKNSVS